MGPAIGFLGQREAPQLVIVLLDRPGDHFLRAEQREDVLADAQVAGQAGHEPVGRHDILALDPEPPDGALLGGIGGEVDLNRVERSDRIFHLGGQFVAAAMHQVAIGAGNHALVLIAVVGHWDAPRPKGQNYYNTLGIPCQVSPGYPLIG